MSMTGGGVVRCRRVATTLTWLAICRLIVPDVAAGEVPAAAEPGWTAYVEATEHRIREEQEDSNAFLALDRPATDEAVRCREAVFEGEICVLSFESYLGDRPQPEIEDALVHHWYGAMLVPSVTLAETLEVVRGYERYPVHFEEIDGVEVHTRDERSLRATLRVSRTHVLTVHYTIDQDATFTRQSPTQVSARFIATRIREIDGAGEPDEREKPPGEDRGFLWALNAYWHYEEVAEGVVLEAEVVSLSRTIPWALRWLVGPFVDGVPRESLEATLEDLRDALVVATIASAGLDRGPGPPGPR